MYRAMSGRVREGLGRLKSTISARMEQMSFRSGAAVFAGVLAAAGVAITLAVALGGHSSAATSGSRPSDATNASRPAVVAHLTPPPFPVLPATPPWATAQATPVASLVPAGGYQPPAPVTAADDPAGLRRLDGRPADPAVPTPHADPGQHRPAHPRGPQPWQFRRARPRLPTWRPA
jgi:hypothetical protein